MTRINEVQAIAIYNQLKKTIDECIKNNEWESYKNQTLGISKWIKDLKKYIENVPFPGPRTKRWADELEDFEKALQKIHYYSAHTEDVILRESLDNNDMVKL